MSLYPFDERDKGVMTRKNQPGNVEAWAIGEACTKAAADPRCGDYIDRGLILLRELTAKGYGVVRLNSEALRSPAGRTPE